jgi:hypothetical protein
MSTSVDQTNIIPGRTQIVSQHILTKFPPCQRGKKIVSQQVINKTIDASEDTKCISTRVDQTPLLPT